MAPINPNLADGSHKRAFYYHQEIEGGTKKGKEDTEEVLSMFDSMSMKDSERSSDDYRAYPELMEEIERHQARGAKQDASNLLFKSGRVAFVEEKDPSEKVRKALQVARHFIPQERPIIAAGLLRIHKIEDLIDSIPNISLEERIDFLNQLHCFYRDLNQKWPSREYAENSARVLKKIFSLHRDFG